MIEMTSYWLSSPHPARKQSFDCDKNNLWLKTKKKKQRRVGERGLSGGGG